MHNIVPKLLIYGDMPKECILMELCDIFAKVELGTERKDILITAIHREIKRILEVATNFGFDKNLWHNYLTFLLITNENPFSITCEKV
ncbi:MAG: AAA family ATPase, partial [Lachnospiraceae bacterium]|nr:AAA family ATPase [Lachnospiraceae bacterium]